MKQASAIAPTTESSFPFVMGQVMAMGLQQWLPQCCYTLCHYNIPDLLGRLGPTTITQIAKECNIRNVKYLEMVLRQLAAFGVLKEIAKDGECAYQLTEVSQFFRKDVPGQPDLSAGFFCANPHPWNSLSRLTESMNTLTFNGLFNLQNGGKSYLDYLRKDAEHARTYFQLGATIAEQCAPLVCKQTKVLSDLNERNAVITDLGGNMGRLIAHVKLCYPNIRAMSVDFPEFVEILRACPPASVELISGDLCSNGEETIPMSDCIIEHNSLLNLPDEEKVKLLRTIYNRLNPGGYLIHVGVELPEPGQITTENISGLTWNLHMMQYAGFLRTPSEAKKLVESIGFKCVEKIQLEDVMRQVVCVCKKI